MPDDTPFDPSQYDFTRPMLDIEAIRAVNPHRHEMELLTAVIHIDTAKHEIVGYKDFTASDFWCRGHMPGFPLVPGVLMCEAAAQLTGFYAQYHKISDPGVLMGLGGIEETRFRRTVRPGERLVMVGTGIRVQRRMTKFKVTGYVGSEKAFETTLIGVPIGQLEELKRA
jgi:3-hydroxyacyl-[acyl-carrier-protein] dehydratase